jgi:trk system potassium uptake protein TrkH
MTNQAMLSDPSITLSTILMFIGGSSGSTAGGVKTTTFAVLLLSILSTTTKRNNVAVGKRQLDNTVVKNAAAIFIFYLFMIYGASLIILGIEQPNELIGFRDVLFEVTSAVGTVGLTSAGTLNFFIVSQAILVVLMFVGRIGALSMIAIFREKAESGSDIIQKPTEKIIIG